MFLLALLFTLTAPFIGLILIGSFPDENEWLTSGVSVEAAMVYYGLFLVGTIVATVQFKKRFVNISLKNERKGGGEHRLILSLLSILVFVLFFYGGLEVLLGQMTKEDVRQFGFAHAFLTKYLSPTIFAYLSAKYRAGEISTGQWAWALIISCIIGVTSGGKASALIALLPGLAIALDGRLTVYKLVALAGGAFGLLIFSSLIFDSFLDGDILKVVEYLVRRAFILTAESPFHVSVAYSNDRAIIEYSLTLLEVFGKSILSGLGYSHEIHKYLFSFSVTAWLYPEYIDKIRSGIWNITPNVFVEALIVGGAFLLPVFGWLVIYGASILWRRVVRQMQKENFANAAVTSVYAVLVYLSWVNSAGIMQLIHPLAIGSLMLSWLFLKILSCTSIEIRQSGIHEY